MTTKSDTLIMPPFAMQVVKDPAREHSDLADGLPAFLFLAPFGHIVAAG